SDTVGQGATRALAARRRDRRGIPGPPADPVAARRHPSRPRGDPGELERAREIGARRAASAVAEPAGAAPAGAANRVWSPPCCCSVPAAPSSRPERAMLSVLNVAYPFAAVDRDPLGGAEQVLALIDDALVRARHQSLVIAREDSRPRGELIPVPQTGGVIGDAERRRAALAHREAIAGALRRHRVDVVHLHGVDFLDYLPATDLPVVVTLHLPLSWYPPAALSLGERVHLVAVSESQRRACGAGAAIAEVVPNGVALERYRPRARRAALALLIGRECPAQRVHVALGG